MHSDVAQLHWKFSAGTSEEVVQGGSFCDWARAWRGGAWRGIGEERLRSKWLSAGSLFARFVPLTWLFLGF